jgi:hypothetical protein
MEPLSVNQALARLDDLAGTDITVQGRLAFEFENVALYHVPSRERRVGCESSIWLSVACGSLAFDERLCARLSGKVVVVEGTLLKPKPFFGGSGHMSLWPAEILARTLERA